MSINTTSRGRRRIAGERRPQRDVVEGPTETTDAPPKVEQPKAPKQPRKPRKPKAPRQPEQETSPAEPGELGPRRIAPSWLTVAGVGVVTALVVAIALVLGLSTWSLGGVRSAERADQARSAAPAVAERATAAILAYDYTSLDADEKAAERYMTPAYRKEYADTFDRLVKPNATKLKAKVEASVRASGATQADPDRVTVLLYANQTTTSTANSGEPQTALNRVQLTMKRVGGTWLVDKITSF